MEMVKMIASVAGEEVFVGECHPARARVLVKTELASWKDGKILLHILGVHDTLLASNPGAVRGPLDDANVSKQEMERRLSWFRSFIVKSSKVLAKMVQPLPSLEEARAWAEAERLKSGARWEDPEVAKLGLPLGTVPWCRVGRRGTTRIIFRTPNSDVVLTDAEVEAYFEKENTEAIPQLVTSSSDRSAERGPLGCAADEFLAERGLPSIWESAPDVSHVFLVHGSHTAPSVTKEAYDTIYERDRMFLRMEYGRKDCVESPPTVVAELDQVRYLWSHNDY